MSIQMRSLALFMEILLNKMLSRSLVDSSTQSPWLKMVKSGLGVKVNLVLLDMEILKIKRFQKRLKVSQALRRSSVVLNFQWLSMTRDKCLYLVKIVSVNLASKVALIKWMHHKNFSFQDKLEKFKTFTVEKSTPLCLMSTEKCTPGVWVLMDNLDTETRTLSMRQPKYTTLNQKYAWSNAGLATLVSSLATVICILWEEGATGN